MRQQIEGVVEIVEVVSATRFSWFGERSLRLGSAIEAAMSADVARTYLVAALQTQLYGAFYATGGATQKQPGEDHLRQTGVSPFAHDLSQRNHGVGPWESGWQVAERNGDQLLVRRDGLALRVAETKWRSVDGTPVIIGDQVEIKKPAGYAGMSPGFYLVEGNKALSATIGSGLVRFYFNLTPAGALNLIDLLTAQLNDRNLPFQFKTADDPSLYKRCDAAVLYVRQSDFATAADVVSVCYDAISDELKPGVPAFTKQLGRGLGLAEDPGTGDSFGNHRCGLLAEGIVSADERGERTIDARIDRIIDTFEKRGIDVDTPYLNPGSTDSYGIDLPRAEPMALASRPAAPGRTRSEEDVAATIGDQLVQQAIWSDDRCVWLGAVTPLPGLGPLDEDIEIETVGADLYAGTAGIAVFLAELYRRTGDDEHRRCAIGALRHAGRLDNLEPTNGSFYTGVGGVIWAMMEVGHLLDDDEWATSASELLSSSRLRWTENPSLDLLTGDAGAIMTCLRLRSLPGTEQLVEQACDHAQVLIDKASSSDLGASWPSAMNPKELDLTGLSHGAAGIAHALLKLHEVTGRPDYLELATEAFRYESRWFYAHVGNWADLRAEPGAGRTIQPGSKFATYWCHGAPGILIPRLEALRLTGDPTAGREAEVAFDTTADMLQTRLTSDPGGFSLCHGLAGNAEILSLPLIEALDESRRERARRLSDLVAELGQRRHGDESRSWPCGTQRGTHPGLMLGLAGIGRFYLQRATGYQHSLLQP